MKKHYRSENNCLNCGASISGNYCSNCGQENLELHDSFWHLAAHGIGHYFHFDSKFFNSIIPLLTKPGYLTKEYFAGKRASHLHPVSMYLFISVTFFFLFLSDINSGDKNEEADTEQVQELSKADLQKEKEQLARARESMAQAKQKMPAAVANSGVANLTTNIIDKSLDSSRFAGLDGNEADAVVLKKEADKQVGEFFGFELTSVEKYEARQQALPAKSRDNMLVHYINRKLLKIFNDKEAAAAFKETLVHNVPKVMFILLPLFALIMMVAFPRSKKYYIEHLVYSIHIHAFIFLFGSILIVFAMIFPSLEDYLQTFGFFVILWYIYRSIRVVYQNSRRRTIFKFIALSLAYSFVLCVSVLVLVFATFMLV
ncbi:DUF3667 domain-containing protein [Pontibacter chitinilyticus]|uniref:DUF3667 domain-containing protein n=1 Tax=Pontibacter chitinilyticus TaxID=2674989 RepID=UPI00321A8A3D